MRLALNDLCSIHPILTGHPVDYAKLGALALERSEHVSPTPTVVEHNKCLFNAEIYWQAIGLAGLPPLDDNRVTEDGAEAIALTYVHAKAQWVAKRRLQRGESADWLLSNASGYLALEVSGTISDSPKARLTEKQQQLARCTLPAMRLAVVIGFVKPTILAGTA